MASTTKAPVEAKVQSATAATYIATLFLTALANGVRDSDASILLKGFPEWLEAILLPIFPAFVAFVAGWLTDHTPRPDLGQPYPGAGESL